MRAFRGVQPVEVQPPLSRRGFLHALVLSSTAAALPPTLVHAAEDRGAAGAAPGGTPGAAEEESARFAQAADYSARHGGRAVLISRSGRIVFERYDRGWNAGRPHPLASGTKSFTGVLAMVAVQDGLLRLDNRAAETLTEWREHPQKSRITVRQLLELSSGLAPGDRELGGRSGSLLLGEVAAQRAKRLGLDGEGPDPDNKYRAALDLPMNHDPGTTFEYGPGHFCAFGELLQRKLARSSLPQKTLLAYLSERLLQPVGIEVARIGRDRAGNPNLPGGMLLTAREWARFGQFVLDEGSVRQPDGSRRSLLRPELLAECFKPSHANPSYGLTWWLRNSDPAATDAADRGGADAGQRIRLRRQQQQTEALKGPDGRPLQVRMAAGLGKQRLYVIPQYQVLVVRFAEGTREGLAFDDRDFLAPILGLEARQPPGSPRGVGNATP